MSERQAKLKRKNEKTEEQHHSKKRSKGEIITNVVIGVTIAACLGLGGWAIADKHMTKAQQTVSQDQTADTQQDASTQQVPTIEEYAQSMGMTGEDFIKEYGLDQSGQDISPSMEMTLATEYMTLGNYAKLQGQDVETVKQSMGLEDSGYNEDTMMSEVLADMQTSAGTADEQQTEITPEPTSDGNSAE